MSDRPSLLTPSDGSYGPLTPSGLTPNTRTEAEAALTLNSITQTDAAGPDPTLLAEGDTSEAQKAYRRRPGLPRTSSTNYETALKRAQQASVPSDTSAHSDISGHVAGETVASPSLSATPFPPPGQGVVPLNYGALVAAPSDSIKKTRSRELSLSGLAQQQGWSEQDYKRVYNSDLVTEPKENAGYGSGSDSKRNGP
ncbi:hypothetical protein J1614_006443 [Plenodomus biglobosus]|nr:hypothetical protein J1614_006443 [Plenodomus biglobosus]